MNDDVRHWSEIGRSFLRDEQGQGLTEYALVVILVAIITIVVMVLMGPYVNSYIDQLLSYFTS